MMKTNPGLFSRILVHQWKDTVRASYWQKSILINVILGVFLVYLLINLVFLGIFLGRIISAAFPGSDPVLILSGLIMYYFMGDLIMRFFMQPVPTISVMPYLHLPVSKNSIFHFLLLKSVFSLFNFLPFIVFIPFVIKNVIPLYSIAAGITWMVVVGFLIFTSNYLSFFIKKLFSARPLSIAVIMVVMAALIWFDIRNGRVVSLFFGQGLMHAAQHPPWILVPMLLLAATYILSWQYLRRHRYMEVKDRTGRHYSSTGRSRFSGIFGITATLVSLELKMILRNNRPRTYLVLSTLFMFYGFMIYPRAAVADGYGMMLFIGLLLTGIMMVQYGQLVFSWESSYFDRLCTSSFMMRDYLNSKFWLFFMFNTVTFIVTIPYALFDYRIVFINMAAWLFNSGVNIFMILFLGTYNTRRLDMSKGAFFNYEGVTAVHFVMMIPVLGLPVFIYWIGSLFLSPAAGIITVGLAGLSGLIFHRRLIDIVSRQLRARKQEILSGFRNG
jgi:hypothetical protein